MIAGLIYADASALMKLVRRERESAELVEWLSLREAVVSSALARVEVLRALRRLGVGGLPTREVVEVFDRVSIVSLSGPVLERAADLPDTHLRSLDAIHLATALSLGELPDAFVTYDKRLATAAARHGLTVVHPGVDVLAP